MKKLLIAGVLILLPTVASAQVFYSDPDVTAAACPTATQVIAAANTTGGGNNRKCTILTNSGTTNKARCGDLNVSSTQGPEVAANSGSITICAVNALYCCGEGGTTTINVGDSRNQ